MTFSPAFNIATRTVLGEVIPLKTTTVQIKDGATVLVTIDSDDEGFVDYQDLGSFTEGDLFTIECATYPSIVFEDISYDTKENAIGRNTTLLFEDLLVGGNTAIEYDVFLVDVDDEDILPEKLGSNLAPNVTYKFDRENVVSQKYKQLVFQCRDEKGQEAKGVIIGDYLTSPTLALPPTDSGGISIGDAIGNTPVSDGLLYTDSSGNLQNNSYLKYDTSLNGIIVDNAKIYTPTVHSIVIGNTGASPLGANTTIIGYKTLDSQTGTGGNTTAIGAYALQAATNTSNSTAVGAYAGYSFTSGSGVFFGLNAGRNVTTGSQGTYFGLSAGYTNTVGIGVTYVGHSAGYYNTGGQNVGIGNYSVRGSASGSTGYFTTGVGSYVFYNLTSGVGNTALGIYSGYKVANGGYNLLAGYRAGYNLISGSSNVILGREAGFNTLGSNNVLIGKNAGYNETGSNKLYIAHSNTTTPLIYGEFDNNVLKVHAGSNVRIHSNGTGLGFFGVTPAAQQTISDGTTQEQLDDVIAALDTLGLALDDR